MYTVSDRCIVASPSNKKHLLAPSYRDKGLAMKIRQPLRAPFVFFTWLLVLYPCAVVVAVPRTRLTWVNGIGYNLGHMEAGKVKIAKLFGGKRVEYCHNPTAMLHEDDMKGYIGDLTQAGTQKLGRVTEEVDSLVSHLRKAVASVGKRGCVVHIAHSQGALVTALAARKMSPIELSKIEVIAFGGAAALQKTSETPFRRCVNYYAANDPLLFLVPEAARALKSGFVADEEFCFLTPREGDPILDHALLGLTYGRALEWEGLRFQKKFQSLAYRSARVFVMFIIALAQAFHRKLKGVLKATFRPLVPYIILLGMVIVNKCAPFFNFLKGKILPPILLLMAVFVDGFFVLLSLWRGNENFVPADPIIKQEVAEEYKKT